ncbi:MAG: mannose-1-phosphate guanylyltransferase/mannose-6-phosphate isomerase, partial [Candidatus Kapaibacteriota bacterium]
IKKIFIEIDCSNIESKTKEIKNIFKTFPDISIDYALMERTPNIVLVKSLFDWDDIGSWDALDRTKNHDEYRNVNIGNNILIDTKNSIVYNASQDGRIVVSSVGVQNLVIVVTDDAVLVCNKDEVQKVKSCVELLKKDPKKQIYL